MTILKRIKHSILTRRGVFEISSGNGLIGIYALRRARGEGGRSQTQSWKHYSPTAPRG